MRRFAIGVVAVSLGAATAPVFAGAAAPRLAIIGVRTPATGLAQTLQPLTLTLNQAFDQRAVNVQRLIGGRWTSIDEGRVSGTQGIVFTRLRGPGVYRLRLLVHDPLGSRRIPSAAVTVRVGPIAPGWLQVQQCDGNLSVAHDGRILWELCSRTDGATLRRTHHEDVGAATSFVLGFNRVWLARRTDVLALDTSADELLPPIPVAGADEESGGIAAGPSGIWLMSARPTEIGELFSPTLVRIDPATGVVTDRIALPASRDVVPRDLRVGARHVWLARYPQHPADGTAVVDYLRVDVVSKAVVRLAAADALTGSGPSGVWAIRRLVSFPTRSGGTLRRLEPVPVSFSADLERFSIRSIAVGQRDLWGLTFRRTGPNRQLFQYFVVRIDPRTGRAAGRLRAIGPPVIRSDARLVVIGTRAWVQFAQLGVLLRAP